MAGFIVLEDGRAYAASNWAYDATAEAISKYVRSTHENDALADWLMEQRCEVQGMGLGRIDLRELTASNRKLLMNVIPRAFAAAKKAGPEQFDIPTYFEGWLKLFEDLVKMIDHVQKKEPPEQFNPHMKGLISATGRHSGPGWD